MNKIKKNNEHSRVIEHAIHYTEISSTLWLSSVAFILLSFLLLVL